MPERRCENMKDVEFLKINKILDNSFIGVDIFHVFTTSFGRLSVFSVQLCQSHSQDKIEDPWLKMIQQPSTPESDQRSKATN